ncbi:NB-ARC domain-containing protein [Actinoplanes sp. NPDC023714]|uniref:WD40 domain-containing protein n=1 Tax=Actinoplanes sp. NPDC023714 TaxID=3154322 RepID=UPI0033C31EA6
MRALPVILAGLLVAITTALSGVALNVATGGDAPWFPTMDQHPLRWLAVSVPSLALGGWLIWWAQRRYEDQRATLIPAAQRPEPWMVDRPRELGAVVRALRRGSSTVGITTALSGAGGFGKTTIARLVRADARVLRHFGRRVYWVTLGRDTRRGALVEKVNDLVRQIDPARAQPFTDVRQAADHLAAVLAGGPRRLVILDDVWFDDQLAAFPVAGRCARLVTTRVAALVAGAAIPVRVDQMSPEQARRVLTADLPAPPPAAVVDGLLVETGNWPLLLRLVNKVIADQLRSRDDVDAVSRDLLARLRREGPLEVDRLTGAAQRELDVTDPQQRDQALSTTIEAGTGLLTTEERDRFAELAVFAEDEVVPVALVSRLWQGSGGVSEARTRMLCARLADLALLDLTGNESGGAIRLHDVLRDYLARRLGAAELARLHGVLLDAARVQPWWSLPDGDRYLRDHLVEHLLAAGRAGEAEALATDLRWVTSRLDDNGPAAPAADLATVGTPKAERLNRMLGRTAHLLTPSEPAGARAAILADRVAHDPDWTAQARELAADSPLSSMWDLPDLPDPAMRHQFHGPAAGVLALAIAPDGTWLASGGEDGAIRVWNPATGLEQRWMRGTATPISAVAVTPDGGRIVSGDFDGTITVWDHTRRRWDVRRFGHEGQVTALAVAPDGTWFASGCVEGVIKLWRTGSGEHLRTFTADAPIKRLAVVEDGKEIAAVSARDRLSRWDAGTGHQRDLAGRLTSGDLTTPDGTRTVYRTERGTIEIRDARTDALITSLTGHRGAVRAVAAAPDGTWIVTAGADGTIRSWSLTGDAAGVARPRSELPTSAVAVSPRGTWLAHLAGEGDDRVVGVRYFGVAGEYLLREIAAPVAVTVPVADELVVAGRWSGVSAWTSVGNPGTALPAIRVDDVRHLATGPDRVWTATVSARGTIRFWDAAGAEQGATGPRPGGITAIAADPGGRWLAAGGDDMRIQVWAAPQARPLCALSGHTGAVTALAAGPADRLVSAGADGTIRRWDVATGQETGRFGSESAALTALALSPDGRWLAVTGLDGTVRVRDAETGEVVALTRIEPEALCCTWHPGGERLLVGGYHGLYCFRFQPTKMQNGWPSGSA